MNSQVDAAAILVVDDEERMRGLLRLYLENEGYRVNDAASGQEAKQLLAAGKFDLIILDLMLPDTDGWTICRTIRAKSDVPIVMLSALGSESERILGFDLGADDYVVKPFSPKELVSRVKALLRRAAPRTESRETIRHGALSIDTKSRIVTCAGTELTLTPKEYELLVLFASHPRQAFSRDQLLTDVWGYDFYGDQRTVDTHIKNLREKLGSYSQAIATIWGVGYRFDPAKTVSGDEARS